MGFFDFLGGIQRETGKFFGQVKKANDELLSMGPNKGRGMFSFLLNEEEKKKEEERFKEVYDNEKMSKQPGFFNFLNESLSELGTGVTKAVMVTPYLQDAARGGIKEQIEKGKTPGMIPGTDIGSRQLSDEEKKKLQEAYDKTGENPMNATADFIAGLPGAITQGAMQVVPRTIGSFTGKDEFKVGANDKNSEARRFFYGDAPAQNIEQYGQDTAGIISEPLGIKKESINPWISLPLGIALTVGDVALGGGGKKKAGEKAAAEVLGALSKADEVGDVLKIMKTDKNLVSLGDDTLKSIAPEIARMTDRSNIFDLLHTTTQRVQSGIDTGKQTVGAVNQGKIIPQQAIDMADGAIRNEEAMKAAQTADYNAQIAARQAEEGQAALDEMIKGRAEQLQGMHKEGKNTLFNDIKSLGGIQSYRDGQLAEEMSGLPVGVRNNTGRPIDEIVAELNGMGHGIEDSNDLLARLSDYKRTTKSKEEFMEEARHQLMHGNDEEAEMFRATQEMMAPVADNAPRMTGQADEMVQPGALPQTEQLLLEAPKPKTYTPGQAKQKIRSAKPTSANDFEVMNKLPDREKAIQLYADIEDTRNVATKTTKSGKTVPIAPHGGEIIVPDIGNVENIKNVSSSLKDPIMRIEQATKEGSKERTAAMDFLYNAHESNKANYVADQEKYNNMVKTITEDLGINNKKLSAAAQDLGEGTLKREDAVARYGEETVGRMEEANKIARQLYDETLDKVNAVRETWGKEPIPRRDDYFRHFQEIGSTLRQLTSGIEESASGLAKGRGSIFNSASKARKGGAYKSDLVGGINDYLNATLRETHFTDSIKRYEAYADAVEAQAEAKGVKNLAGFVNRLREQAKAIGSQPVGYDVPLSSSDAGKKALNVMSWVQQRVGKNTIIGNASSALAQTLGWAGAPAEIGTKNTFLGAMDNLASITGKAADDVIDKSPFLRERYFKANEIKSMGQKMEGVVAKPFEIIERATTDAIWRGSYRRALGDGLKGDEAIRQADMLTKKIVGGRGIGDKALAFESKTGNTAMQFQLEVNNLYQRYMKEAAGIGGHSKINPKKLATFAVTTYLMNSAFEQITGRRPLPDFIDAGIEAGQDLAEGNVKGAVGRIPGEILANAPGGQTIASFLPEDVRKEYLGQTDVGRYSGTIPVAEVAKDVVGLASDPGKSASDLVASVGAPFAGKPSQRFLNAGIDYQKGYTETPKGEVKYQTGDMGDFIKSALFGQNATAEGKSYYEDQLKPLSDKQSAYVKKTMAQQRNNPDREEAENVTRATIEYFQTRQKVSKKVGKQKYSDMITEAIGKGDRTKARQLAREYNTKVAQEFRDYGSKYGRYAQKEIASDYKKMFIKLNSQSISRRMKSYKQSNYEETTR